MSHHGNAPCGFWIEPHFSRFVKAHRSSNTAHRKVIRLSRATDRSTHPSPAKDRAMKTLRAKVRRPSHRPVRLFLEALERRESPTDLFNTLRGMALGVATY